MQGDTPEALPPIWGDNKNLRMGPDAPGPLGEYIDTLDGKPDFLERVGQLLDGAPMTDTPDIDTSADAVERLAAEIVACSTDHSIAPAWRERKAVLAATTLRALARENAELRARVAGWIEAFDRSTKLREQDAAERRHLVAEMTRRSLLPVLQEVDREWLAQAAAYAETHGVAEGDRPADPERETVRCRKCGAYGSADDLAEQRATTGKE